MEQNVTFLLDGLVLSAILSLPELRPGEQRPASE
jgi:hypothetical protein